MSSIILSDGTELQCSEINGTLIYFDQEIDFDEIAKKLSPVTIREDSYEETYNNAKLGCRVTISEKNSDESLVTRYIISIIPISDDEMAVTEGLDFIAEHLLTDEQAVQVPYFFHEWDPNGVAYTAEASKVQYNGLLYKCLQSHTSQASWTPTDAPSLWVRIDNPAEEWPEWRQPSGSTDAYSKGDKVSHNGKHWISNVDGTNTNTWEPGVFGWDEQPSDE